MRGLATTCIVLLALSACQRTKRDIQLDEAARMTPRNYRSVSENGASGSGEVTTLRARVWVEDAYRGEVVRWREHIEEQFERASAMGERAAAIRFELVGISSWVPDAAELPNLVDELAAHDEGENVDLVVAMTGSFPGLTQSQHVLGYGEVLGKHVVLRAMNDSAEWARFEKMFDRLKAEERRALYRERLRHKEAAVLLHEVGHNFGALHTRADGCLMSPTYSVEGDRFCRPNDELLTQTVRLRKTADSLTVWRQQSIDVMKDATEGAENLDKSVLGSLTSNAGALAVEDARQLEQVRELLEGGDVDRARERVGALHERLPDHPAVQEMHCIVEAHADVDASAARASCERALELAPESFSATLNLGILCARDEDWVRAEKLAMEADAIATDRERLSGSSWVALAGLYLELRMPSKALAALDHTEMLTKAASLRRSVNELRNYWCVPAGGVEPQVEGRAIRRLRVALKKLREGDATELESLRDEFPNLPALDAIDCEKLLSQGERAKAEQACRDAIEQGPCYMAQRSLGVLYRSTGRLDLARKHLEAAQRLYDRDPSVGEMLDQIGAEQDAD